MHAIGFLYTDLAKKYTNLEPYFEDEPVAELGYSFENAVSPYSHARCMDDF